MAALALSKPGKKDGPCESECQHRDCAERRARAAKVCHFCQKPIGFARRFYNDPDNTEGLVHADCLDVATWSVMA